MLIMKVIFYYNFMIQQIVSVYISVIISGINTIQKNIALTVIHAIYMIFMVIIYNIFVMNLNNVQIALKKDINLKMVIVFKVMQQIQNLK